MRGLVRFGRVTLLGVAIAVLGSAAVGCKSSKKEEAPPPPPPPKASSISGEKASKTVASLAETGEKLGAGKAQVKATILALNTLKGSSADNLEANFKAYQATLAKMRTQAKDVAQQAEDMNARAADYRSFWQSEVSKMDSPELRAGAAERAAKIGERFDTIRSKFEGVRAAYQPFLKECNEVETYLGKDVSPTALTVSAGAIDKAVASGNTVTKRADDAIAEVMSVSVKMRPDTK